MAGGILLITHPKVGQTLLETAASLLGKVPIATAVLDVPLGHDTEAVHKKAAHLCAQLDDGTGVLVLTDLYGATPDNIACHLRNKHQVRVVSGMNLPMLLKTFNYHALALRELAQKAQAGGCRSIVEHGPGHGRSGRIK